MGRRRNPHVSRIVQPQVRSLAPDTEEIKFLALQLKTDHERQQAEHVTQQRQRELEQQLELDYAERKGQRASSQPPPQKDSQHKKGIFYPDRKHTYVIKTFECL